MKLLLDENLSRRIVPFCKPRFPALHKLPYWDWKPQAILKSGNTKDNGFVIVSRDSDFQERSLVAGHPPQVIWLKIPNRSKTVVLNILLEHQAEIEQALTVHNLACVELNHHG